MMSPRWILCLVCLLLALLTPVAPQVAIGFIRTTLCSVCSGAFIALSCTAIETTACRVMAFKLSLMCRTFPCTNYGAPNIRTCEAPLGCPPWNVRPFGLCGPLQVCCSNGLAGRGIQPKLVEAVRSKFKNSKLRASSRKSALSKLRFSFGKTSEKVVSAATDMIQNEASAFENETALLIPSTPMEYMKDWPEDGGDPTIVELTIIEQYVKLVKELNAINKQEKEDGTQEAAIKIPRFEDFRSVAMGETSVQ